jgi:MFS superfamily sulfate permease-like transporter
MKKAVVALAWIFMILSAEPARAVNIPDWGLAGILGVIVSETFHVTDVIVFCKVDNKGLYSTNFAVKFGSALLFLVSSGVSYGLIKAAKYFERKEEEEEEEEEVKRNWLGIRKKG